MNDIRRAMLRARIDRLRDTHRDIKDIMGEEEEAKENLPPGLDESAMADEMQEAVDYINEALQNIDSAVTTLETVIGE